jgi:hypothetical protein
MATTNVTITLVNEQLEATLTGLLLAETRTLDIVDAHVVVCVRRSGQAIVTSDAAELRRLDSTLQLLLL